MEDSKIYTQSDENFISKGMSELNKTVMIHFLWNLFLSDEIIKFKIAELNIRYGQRKKLVV